MTKSLLRGFLQDEVDDAAKDIIQHLAECETPSAMCLLALCRAVVMISTVEELDLACRVIDEMSEIPLEKPYPI